MFKKKYHEWPINIRFEGKLIQFIFNNKKDAIKFSELVTFVETYHPELMIIHGKNFYNKND